MLAYYGPFREPHPVLYREAPALAPGRANGLYVVVVGEEVRVPFLVQGFKTMS